MRVFILLLSLYNIIAGYASPPLGGVAQSKAEEQHLTADSVHINHTSDSVQVVMRVHLPDKVDRNDVELLEVRFVHDKDSVILPSVGVYGKRPYYTTVRSGLYLFQNPETDIFLRWKDAGKERFFYTRAQYPQVHIRKAQT